MQFTTRISQSDFVAAYRLRCRSAFRIVLDSVMYVLGFLSWALLLSAFFNQIMNPTNPVAQTDAATVEGPALPFAVLVVLWVFLFKFYLPRRRYKADSNLKGEMYQEINEGGVLQQSSAGASLFFPWPLCGYWKESKHVFILVLQSGIYFLFPKSGLELAQQEEIRSLLSRYLKRK